jgi:hypothetical protein
LVFIEVRSKSKLEEIVQTENNPEKVLIELRNEEDDLDESSQSKEELEQPTSVVRRSEQVRKPFERYSPLDFCSTFVLNTTNDEPKSVEEVVNPAERKILKDAMVEEMESLHKNDM